MESETDSDSYLCDTEGIFASERRFTDCVEDEVLIYFIEEKMQLYLPVFLLNFAM